MGGKANGGQSADAKSYAYIRGFDDAIHWKSFDGGDWTKWSGTGPVTEALVRAGVAPSRLVLVEFDAGFCRILRSRFPDATLVQGDAYSLRRLLEALLLQPAAAVVSGLPLVTKPLKMRLRLIRDAFDLMLPGAPFVQFTYSVASPLPRRLGGFSVEASERIWMNIPPARVWVYRKN